MKPFTMRIEGPFPSKKNRQMGNGFRISKTMHAKLDDLMWQMKRYWVGRHPVSRPHLKFELYMQNWNADADNVVTTLLDCMVTAGVLVNDNLKHLGHFEVFADSSALEVCLITVAGGEEVRR